MIIIKPTLNVDEYDVLFQHNNNFYCGIVTCKINPLNLSSHFDDWVLQINNNFGKLKVDLTESKSEEQVTGQIIDDISRCTLLTYVDGCYYRNNANISLPLSIAKKYVEIENNLNEVEKLDKFWNYVSMSEKRESIFDWMKNNWEITDDGLLVVYRNVNKIWEYLNSNNAQLLIDFFTKIKKQKKGLKNYFLNVEAIKKSNVIIQKEKSDISLHDIYNNKVFTHNYNSPNRFFYKLGEEVSMNRNDADFDDSNTCSSSFHSRSKIGLEQAGQYDFGDGNTICCLLNPMQISAIPKQEDKIRSISLYFVNTVQWKDGKIIPLSAEEINLHSSKYAASFNNDLDLFKNDVDNNPKYLKFKGLKREVIFI